MATRAQRSCLICTTPRTGSWLLGEALAATGCCGEPEEYFRPDWLWLFSQKGRLEPGHHMDFINDVPVDGWTYPDPDSFQIEAFLAAVRNVGTNDKGMFSAKLHWNQFGQVVRMAKAHGLFAAPDEAMLRAWFPNPLYIFLTRRDKLRQAVSYYRAIQSNVWHVRVRDDELPEHADIPLLHEQDDDGCELRAEAVDHAQVEQLRSLLKHQEAQWRKILSAADLPVVRVCYEEVIENLPAAVDTVLAALDSVTPPARYHNIVKRFHCQADGATEVAVHDHQRWSVVAHSAFHKTAAPTDKRAQTIVVENFYADPEAVLKYALRQPYYFP